MQAGRILLQRAKGVFSVAPQIEVLKEDLMGVSGGGKSEEHAGFVRVMLQWWRTTTVLPLWAIIFYRSMRVLEERGAVSRDVRN